jgi:osmoprotectant transport system ATP-binding protein
MIKVQGISKSFGSAKAVSNISFEVAEGETLVLLGKSGCGKTTTLRMLNRLITPSQGRIELRDQDISTIKPEILRRGMGYVLQHHGLFPHYTVAENLAIVPKLLEWDTRRIQNRSEELLEKLKLPYSEYHHFYPAGLSGGQQQRVGLARALMVQPPVLLMDEPLGALDPLTRISIRKELNQLDELKSKTIVMVTHDIPEAFELANRICLMDQGRIIQIGTPFQLLFEPANEFVRLFFQDQRMQLELMTLTIADVWNDIRQTRAEQIPKNLSQKTTLWDALTCLLLQKDKLVIIDGPGQESKISGHSELMNAYSEFKDRYR